MLNSTKEDFAEKFRELAKELKASVLLECIGSDTTPTYLEMMPSRSHCVFYGSMRESALEGFDPLLFIGRGYSIEGFILDGFVKSKNIFGLLGVINKVRGMMSDATL